MKQKTKKLFCMLTAFVMIFTAFSVNLIASAVDAYKPQYSEKVTEEDISLLLGDVNTILAKDVLNGKAIEEIYKVLPSLASIVKHSTEETSAKGSFYKNGYPEKFADFPDGDIVADEFDEEGKLVKEGTFTAFFKEHPIVCNNLDEFKNELNKIIDLVIINNTVNTLQFAFVMEMIMGGDLTAVRTLCGGLDSLSEVIGAKQTANSADVFGISDASELKYDVEGVKTYLKNIVGAVLPNITTNVLNIVKNAVNDDTNTKLYGALTDVLANLETVLTSLKDALAGMINIDDVKAQITEINKKFAAIPTLGEADAKRFDIEGLLAFLIDDLTTNALSIEYIDRPEYEKRQQILPISDERAMVSVKFRHMKLDRLENSQSPADTAKIIYDYLYDNLIADATNNGLIKVALDLNIIENALKIQIPKDVKDFIYKALKMENLELANELVVVAANAAGRELPIDPPVDPEQPTDPPKPDDEQTDPSTKPENPTKPGGQQGSGSDTDTDTDTDTTPIPQDDDNVGIPNTSGVISSGASMAALAATAILATLASRAKKDEEE